MGRATSELPTKKEKPLKSPISPIWLCELYLYLSRDVKEGVVSLGCCCVLTEDRSFDFRDCWWIGV